MEEVAVADVSAAPVEAAPEIQSDVPAEAPVIPETPPVVQEKMIPQSQVNKIAAREAKQAAEKARRELAAEYEQRNVQQQVAETPVTPNMGGMIQMTPEQFERQLYAAAQKMSTQSVANKMAQDFESKINAEIESDPDFGDLYDSLNITAHPELVIWMNGMDNSAKVVKDLAQNPTKFANILMLAKSGMGQLAERELKKLSESIKTNMAAQSQSLAKPPLDQLSPSNIGADNGEMSVSDFMKQDWLRG